MEDSSELLHPVRFEVVSSVAYFTLECPLSDVSTLKSSLGR